MIRSEKYYNKVFDLIVDLDVTSPLRNIKDINESIKKIINENTNNLITVCKARKNPYFNMIEYKNNFCPKLVKKSKKNIIRRQDAPTVYEMNASIYIWRRDFLMNNNNLFTNKTSVYQMPFKRSIDIDSVDDLNLVRYFVKKNEKKLVFIVGGNGSIGSEIVKKFIKLKNHKIIILDIKNKKYNKDINQIYFDLGNLKNINTNLKKLLKNLVVQISL